MSSRTAWLDIQRDTEYHGRWVALDDCVYDAKTAQPLEGSVVDADDDLVALCTRVRASEGLHCAILFCGSDSAGRRPSMVPGR